MSIVAIGSATFVSILTYIQIGTLFMNARALLTHRLASYSNDGGVTWTEASVIPGLIEPLEGMCGYVVTNTLRFSFMSAVSKLCASRAKCFTFGNELLRAAHQRYTCASHTRTNRLNLHNCALRAHTGRAPKRSTSALHKPRGALLAQRFA